MTTNYFSVSMDVASSRGAKKRHAEQFFFDGSNPVSIRKAFEAATSAFLEVDERAGGQVAVYKAPKIAGPWDGINVIGVSFRDLPPE